METFYEQVRQLDEDIAHVLVSFKRKVPFAEHKAEFDITFLDGPLAGETMTAEAALE